MGSMNNPQEGFEQDHSNEDDLLALLGEQDGEYEGKTAPSELDNEDDDTEFNMDDDGEQQEDAGDEDDGDFLTRKFRIKAGEEEVEVSGDELTKGYQRQADYTRKTQALAEERKAIEAEKAQIAQLQQQYLEALGKQGDAELAKFKDVDWAKLRAEDPDEYLMKRAEYQEAQERANHANFERQRVMEEQQKQQQQLWAQYVQQQNEALSGPDGIPGWADPEKGSEVRKAIREYAANLGFADEELNTLADARALKVLDKARRYDELLAKSGKVAQKRKAKPVPRVAKAGAAGRSGVPGKKQAAIERLRRTGSDMDAAAAIFQMLDE